jgi:hypothetical protein
LLICSLVLGGFAAIGIWYFGTMHDVKRMSEAVLLMGLCVAFLLFSSYLLVLILVSRVVLWPDRIEYREVFNTRQLSRDGIIGRRLLKPSNGPSTLVLVPRDHLKKLKIGVMYNFDQAFWDWIDALPDLDNEDRRAAEQEILSNSEIGASTEDRIAALTLAKRVSMILTGVACALGIWAWIYARPHRLVVASLALLPWVAVLITMRSGGLFRIDSRKNDPHPTVAIPFLMPGGVLTLLALSEIHILLWKEALIVSVFLAAALATAAFVADRSMSSHKGTAVVILLLSGFYGYGASAEANAILDRSAVSSFQSQIIGRRISGGRSTTYYLKLNPWGPKRESDEVSISRSFYDSVHSGDTVCIALREGALHIRWYTVRPCQ